MMHVYTATAHELSQMTIEQEIKYRLRHLRELRAFHKANKIKVRRYLIAVWQIRLAALRLQRNLRSKYSYADACKAFAD